MRIVIEVDEAELPPFFQGRAGTANLLELIREGLVLLPMEKKVNAIGDRNVPLQEVYSQTEEVGRLLYKNLRIVPQPV